MDYTGITFGLEVLISIVFAVGSALGVYYKLKNNTDLLLARIKTLETTLEKLETQVDQNREKSDTNVSELKDLIRDMKVDIIKEIHQKK